MHLARGRLEGESLAFVSTHLADCPECRALVAAAAGASKQVERIGRFRVLDLAGRGAMGAVYRGVDERLERPVALKVISSANVGADSMARLEREARSLAQIDHPNVVSVYEVGESQPSEVYVAMEFVDGGTLAEWLRSPRRSEDIVSVFAAAGRGLQAAHDAGLVHRDFKPTNVLITGDGGVKVADFGLADDSGRPALAGSINSTDVVRTQTGALLGTPAYMAPEQLAAGAATAASDQFAFCVALFEALAGHRPFEGGTIAELSRALHSGQPLRPRRPIPGRIHSALRRGLATHPSDRFPSMNALLAELEPRRSRKRVAIAAAMIAVVAAGAGGLALALANDDKTASVCDAAETQWNEFFSDEQKQALRGAMMAAWPAEPPAGASAKARDNWQGLGRVRASLALDTVRRYGEDWRSRYQSTCSDPERIATHEAKSRRACLDNALIRAQAVVRSPSAERFSDSMTEAREQLERCSTHLVSALALPDDAVFESVAAARRDLADAAAARERRELSKAETLANKAAEVGDSTGFAPLSAEAWLELGDVARVRGEADRSIEANRKALASAQTSSYHRVIRRASDNLAWQHYFGKSNPKESERWLEASRALDGKLPPTDYERVLRMTLEAQLSRAAGKLDDAIAKMRGAIALAVEKKQSAATIARAREGLVTLLMHKLDFETASVEIEKLAPALDSFSQLVLLRQRASLASLMGKDAEAADGFEIVAAMRADDPSVAARYLLRAGQARIRLKQLDAARALLDRAEVLAPKGPLQGDIACARADVLAARDKLDEAITARKTCLASIEAQSGPLSRSALFALGGLARLYDKRGDVELALDHLERAVERWERVEPTSVSVNMNRFAIARLLIQRGRAADRERADGLAKTAENQLRDKRPEISKFIAKWRRLRSR